MPVNIDSMFTWSLQRYQCRSDQDMSFPTSIRGHMFSIALRQAGHTRKYHVSPSNISGWDLTLLEDLRPIRQVHYDDWHRVERTLNVFTMRVETLKNEGWVAVPADTTIATLVRAAGRSS